MIAEAREALPELPAARRERYVSEVGVPEEAASVLAFDEDYGEYFERALAAGGASAAAIANWVTGELVAALRSDGTDTDPLASKATPDAVAAPRRSRRGADDLPRLRQAGAREARRRGR